MRPLSVAVALLVTVSLVPGCASESSPGTGYRAAAPDFCDWAAILVAQVPQAPASPSGPGADGTDDEPDATPEPTTPPLTMERLASVATDLRSFADAADEAAAHASSADAPHFTTLANFNRVVAAVIAGSSEIDPASVEPARRAADRVSAILSNRCNLAFEPADGLAFVQAP